MLESSGAIVTAARADDALRVALIAEGIVCDLESAEMAGSEFLSERQRLHVRLGRTVPTIALVPVGTRSARVRAAGFHAHLTKPVDGDDRKAAVLDRSVSKPAVPLGEGAGGRTNAARCLSQS